jgi:hypothetical protein
LGRDGSPSRPLVFGLLTRAERVPVNGQEALRWVHATSESGYGDARRPGNLTAREIPLRGISAPPSALCRWGESLNDKKEPRPKFSARREREGAFPASFAQVGRWRDFLSLGLSKLGSPPAHLSRVWREGRWGPHRHRRWCLERAKHERAHRRCAPTTMDCVAARSPGAPCRLSGALKQACFCSCPA